MSIAFVTGLPHYVSSQAVETAARKVGPIERVVRPLARDGSRLHFAYVFCEDADTAATLVSDGLKVVTDDFDAVLDVQASTKTEEEILSKRSTKARVRRVQDRHVNDDSNYTFGLRLFVGNLDSATTTEELAGVFARFGEVQSVVRPVAATDSAFVTMTTYQAAGAAVDAFLSGSESLRAADQTSVRVEFARPQTERRVSLCFLMSIRARDLLSRIVWGGCSLRIQCTSRRYRLTPAYSFLIHTRVHTHAHTHIHTHSQVH
ncbi:MAG: hypothetical protein MHM6MM_000830 [Cercozoa sp. M6MM]